MPTPRPHLELLAPARNAEIGKQAVLHGADAVYIGGPSFGARLAADNSAADIAELASFAHRFGVRIFATLNTILHDAELEPARDLVWQFFESGVDALIVQDMGLMELDLPPIQIHASTQCDIRTVEKARFLGEAGFSQLVLARELGLDDIRHIAEATDATLEFFIHGALCVAFSGQCYISHAHTGRSANRGDCSQACRLPYTLTDEQGRVVAFEKHLLSMKDNDQSANLAALVDAGVRSFKIEGRYKDADYVKNITAHYRRLLDDILDARPDLARASAGRCTYTFSPDPARTFNRGSTDYFVTGRREDIGAFDSPSHRGLPLGVVARVGPDWFDLDASAVPHNGDGLTWMHKRTLQGTRANVVSRAGPHWRIQPADPVAKLAGLRPGTEIWRNLDHAWEGALRKPSAQRRIALRMVASEVDDRLELRVTDETGVAVSTRTPPLEIARDDVRAEAALRESLGKLGGTPFEATDIQVIWTQPRFVPAAIANTLRRQAVEALEQARLTALKPLPRAVPRHPPTPYPEASLSYLANVYNEKARAFYARHGVQLIESAYEGHEVAGEVSLMITKHCLRYSFQLCPKQAKGVPGVQGQVRAEPMTLVSQGERLRLRFDCRACEMHVVGAIKPHILRSPPPSAVPVAPLTFHRQRPG